MDFCSPRPPEAVLELSALPCPHPSSPGSLAWPTPTTSGARTDSVLSPAGLFLPFASSSLSPFCCTFLFFPATELTHLRATNLFSNRPHCREPHSVSDCQIPGSSPASSSAPSSCKRIHAQVPNGLLSFTGAGGNSSRGPPTCPQKKQRQRQPRCSSGHPCCPFCASLPCPLRPGHQQRVLPLILRTWGSWAGPQGRSELAVRTPGATFRCRRSWPGPRVGAGARGLHCSRTIRACGPVTSSVLSSPRPPPHPPACPPLRRRSPPALPPPRPRKPASRLASAALPPRSVPPTCCGHREGPGPTRAGAHSLLPAGKAPGYHCSHSPHSHISLLGPGVLPLRLAEQRGHSTLRTLSLATTVSLRAHMDRKP